MPDRIGHSFILYNIFNSSTETIRKINPCKNYIDRHKKLLSDDVKFGSYLAGLIEGDVHFSNKNQLIIVFHLYDLPLVASTCLSTGGRANK